MRIPEAKDWHIDVDKRLNPYIPQNLAHRLPRPISHFLGYRDRPRTGIGNILVAGWALIGAFVGVVVLEAAFMASVFKDHGVPLLIASFVCLVLRIRVFDLTLIYIGRCGHLRVQYYRVTTRPASKCYNRTRYICRCWRRHHKALQAQCRFREP